MHEVGAGLAAAAAGVGVPDVLADEGRDPDAAELDDDGGVARLEVALLVEDLVVRQARLR